LSRDLECAERGGEHDADELDGFHDITVIAKADALSH